MKWFLCSQILFGTWYKSVLFLLMLSKQLVHMYVVELGFIWIWKCIENCFDIIFQKCWNCFFKKTFHQKKRNCGNILDLFIVMSMYIEFCVCSFIVRCCFTLFDWIWCFTWISCFRSMWNASIVWWLNFAIYKKFMQFVVNINFMWFII
jgi:hypothetical protein